LKRSHVLGLATAVAALGAPALAEAATLNLGAACTYSGAPLELSGSGFSPNATVTLSGAASGTATTDSTGSFSQPFRSPASSSLAGRTETIQAAEAAGGTPANTAQVKVKVVKDLLATNAPISGNPGGVAVWRFAGFEPGKPIYGHYRYKGRTLRNYRFGLASGPCGTLTVRARRVPTTSRPGSWTLQLDQHKAYVRNTEPRRTITFTIVRRSV
jgi:hypothetical protein